MPRRAARLCVRARARVCVCAAAVPAAGRRPSGSHGAGGVSTQPGVPDMLTNLREDQDDSRIRAQWRNKRLAKEC